MLADISNYQIKIAEDMQKELHRFHERMSSENPKLEYIDSIVVFFCIKLAGIKDQIENGINLNEL